MAPLNILVPQVFIQQQLSGGDPEVACQINATGITLDWTVESGEASTKYIPLNKSNIGICFTASGYQNFLLFATLCGMLATYISDDDDKLPKPSREEDELPIIMVPTNNNEFHAPSNSPLQMLVAPIHTPSEGVFLGFLPIHTSSHWMIKDPLSSPTKLFLWHTMRNLDTVLSTNSRK